MEIIDRLAVIDRSDVTVRDVRLLHAIAANGGLSGNDLVTSLKLPSRSSIQQNLPKLCRLGLIIDKRRRPGQAIPGRFFITPMGEAIVKAICE